ncbi:GPI-anchored protein LLG1 [Sesamum angolense]|uniref:GPI-anchored protein LLG1 n=1 Tax=Sesamum angolense TaxID=2727404 RepID=A0AAE1X2G7_9LAMI|nr:GPI-anchored protein LLG1 [Sesamum angolense]
MLPRIEVLRHKDKALELHESVVGRSLRQQPQKNKALELHESVVGRSLRQQPQKTCKAVENLNYSLLTSQCKGPNYTVQHCCVPLKQLLCPILHQFNDLSTPCAEMFFCNANYLGSPTGLFHVEGKEGESLILWMIVIKWFIVM